MGEQVDHRSRVANESNMFGGATSQQCLQSLRGQVVGDTPDCTGKGESSSTSLGPDDAAAVRPAVGRI